MIAFDPYGILEIGRDAGPHAVKTAYRRKVQSAHPDRGGDPDLFILVVKAFGVLSDPDARRLFDETGIVDEGGVRDYRRASGSDRTPNALTTRMNTSGSPPRSGWALCTLRR